MAKKESSLKKILSVIEEKTEGISQNQRLIIAIAATIITAVIVFYVMAFFNALIDKIN